MINTHLENIWFCSIVADPIYIDTANPSFFKDERYQEAFKIVKSFWKKYSQIPSPSQIKEVVKILKIDDKLQPYQVDSIFDIDLSEYDPEWLRENTEAWIEWKNLEQSAMDSITYIKSTNVTPENIKDVVNTFKTIINDRNSLDFSFDLGLDFNEPENHKQPKSSTFPSGYDFIDLVLGGGFAAKNLYVFLGQPKVGKCNLGIAKIRDKATKKIYTIKLENLYGKITNKS